MSRSMGRVGRAHLASSGRPGLPGRARGAGPPNPVRRTP